VLVYYAITNGAAWSLPAEDRIFPAWVSAAGLVCCVSLAVFVEPIYVGIGLGVIALGLFWHRVARATRERSDV